MAYQPTVWAENDLISIERMNKLEQGVVAANEPPAIAAEDIGAVPITRTVNGKALDQDINLTASNVGARSNSWVPTAAQVGAIPSTSVTSITLLTQAEYDALTTIDTTTLYLIKEEA